MSKYKLMEHQKECCNILRKKKRFAIFADCGTGKTLMMIHHLQYLWKKRGIRRVIIFCPSSVTLNWKSEIEKFSKIKFKVQILEGTKQQRDKLDLSEVNILIVNYEKSIKDFKKLLKFKADVLVLDESHRVKTHTSQTTRNIYKLSKNIERKYIMTGTPMSKGYEDIYSQFMIMKPEVFGTSFPQFREKYLVMGGYMNKIVKGYRNKKNLKKKVDKNCYKVRKEDCMDLPPVTEKTLYCNLGPKGRKHYKEIMEDMFTIINEVGIDVNRAKSLLDENNVDYKGCSYIGILDKASDYSEEYKVALDLAITKSIKLHQICGGFIKTEQGSVMVDDSKIKLLKDVLNDIPKPVVIFCNFRSELDFLKSDLANGVSERSISTITGSTHNKGEIVEQFQNGDIDILLVQIASGSTGINLTKSHNAIFFSMNYKLTDYLQAKSRLDRKGQNEPVTLYYLVCQDTIDEELLNILSRREKTLLKLMK